MTPEQKKHINDFLRQIGSEKTVDELEAIRKRAVRTLNEWRCQDLDQRKALPEEIKDIQKITSVSLFMTLAGLTPLPDVLDILDMTIEAAYNLGKANKPLSKTSL